MTTMKNYMNDMEKRLDGAKEKAEDVKENVLGFMANMENQVEDGMERYKEKKFAKNLKKQMEKEHK